MTFPQLNWGGLGWFPKTRWNRFKPLEFLPMDGKAGTGLRVSRVVLREKEAFVNTPGMPE